MGAADRIVEDLLPEFTKHFLTKSGDYNHSLIPGVENADVLGPQGQYAELWRKMAKLKKSLWDGVALNGEQPREILLDFIGHCFLAIDMLDRKQMAEDPPMPALPIQPEVQPALAGDMPEWRRIGVDLKQWNVLVALADRVDGEGPIVLEREGFMILHVFPSTTNVCGIECSESRHQYRDDCNFRIRRRRNA